MARRVSARCVRNTLSKGMSTLFSETRADEQIFSHSINEYCNKLEQHFAKEMTVVAEEIAQPIAAPSSQKAAWIEKARSTIANLQGEKKIQAFFNFVPQVCGSSFRVCFACRTKY